jgi:cytidine deaminase
MTDRELIEKALDARKNAYIPYSHYAVGAAVLTGDGCVYTGCNIENAAFSATICAERTAIFKAVSEGHRTLSRIAIAAAPEGESAPLSSCGAPCGVCRQVMAEFAAPDFRILLARSAEDYDTYTLPELLPLSFTSKDM